MPVQTRSMKRKDTGSLHQPARPRKRAARNASSDTKTVAAPLVTVPVELILMFCDNLSWPDRFRLASTCKRLRQIITSRDALYFGAAGKHHAEIASFRWGVTQPFTRFFKWAIEGNTDRHKNAARAYLHHGGPVYDIGMDIWVNSAVNWMEFCEVLVDDYGIDFRGDKDEELTFSASCFDIIFKLQERGQNALQWLDIILTNCNSTFASTKVMLIYQGITIRRVLRFPEADTTPRFVALLLQKGTMGNFMFPSKAIDYDDGLFETSQKRLKESLLEEGKTLAEAERACRTAMRARRDCREARDKFAKGWMQDLRRAVVSKRDRGEMTEAEELRVAQSWRECHSRRRKQADLIKNRPCSRLESANIEDMVNNDGSFADAVARMDCFLLSLREPPCEMVRWEKWSPLPLVYRDGEEISRWP